MSSAPLKSQNSLEDIHDLHIHRNGNIVRISNIGIEYSRMFYRECEY